MLSGQFQMAHQEIGEEKLDIERLNVNMGGEACAGYTGSDALFEKIAAKVGRPLPEAYIRFIRTVDGGCPEVNTFYVEGEDPDNYFGVNGFYSFGEDGYDDIMSAIDDWKIVLGKRAVPIADDGGGNQIYLDMNDAVPSVWLYLHDEDELKLKVADSFEEFIASLMIDPDLDD